MTDSTRLRRAGRVALAACVIMASGAGVPGVGDSLQAGAAPGPSPVAPADRSAPAPGAAASGPQSTARPVALLNAGFEDGQAGASAPDGWRTTQHAGVPSYRFALDEQVARSGRRSLRVDNIGPEPFGAIYQTTPAAPHIGKRLRFSAQLRVAGVGAGRGIRGAFLLVQAMRTGVPVAEDRMMDRPIKGDRDWQRETVELVVPPGTDEIEVGAMLLGAGSLWIDDAQLVVVAPD